MKLTEMECPNCGAPLIYDKKTGMAVCEYCDTKVTIDAGFKSASAEEAGYNFEKGRQRAQQESAQDARRGGEARRGYYNASASKGNYSSYEQPKRRRTWLWVLGWIFFFPAPLTVLIYNRVQNPVLKWALIIFIWSGVIGGCSGA